MGDSAREVMEVTCPSCDTKFRLRLTKGRLPRQGVECPSCGATIPVADEQPKAAIIKRNSDQKTDRQDSGMKMPNVPETPAGGTLLGLPIEGIFEFPGTPGAFDREPTAVKNPNTPLPLNDLGEISDSEFKNTTRQPWENEKTTKASSLQAMAASEVDNFRETPFKGLSSTSSSARDDKPKAKPKLNELLKRVREKRGNVPDPKFSFDSVAEMLEESAQSISEASNAPVPSKAAEPVEPAPGLPNVQTPKRAVPKFTRPNSDNRKTSPAMDPAFRRLAEEASKPPPEEGLAGERKGSGYIRLPTAELLEVIGEGAFKLRVGKMIYEPVNEDGLVKLIKGGVLMGAEYIADADGEWMPVNEHPTIQRLRQKMAEEAHALLQGISASREVEQLPDPISEEAPSLETPPTEEISDELLMAQNSPPPLPPEVSEISEVEEPEVEVPALAEATEDVEGDPEPRNTTPGKKTRVLPLLLGLAAVGGLLFAGFYYYFVAQADRSAEPTPVAEDVKVAVQEPEKPTEPEIIPEPQPVVEEIPPDPKEVYAADPNPENALAAIDSLSDEPIEAALFAYNASQSHPSAALKTRFRELQIAALDSPFTPEFKEATQVTIDSARALEVSWNGETGRIFLENANDDSYRRIRASSVLCALVDCGFGAPLVLNVEFSQDDLSNAPKIEGLVWEGDSGLEKVEGILVVNPSGGANLRLAAMQGLWRAWMNESDELLDSPLVDQRAAFAGELGEEITNALLEQAEGMSVRDFLKGVSAVLTFDFLTNNSDRFDGQLDNLSLRGGRFYSLHHTGTFKPRASTRVRGRFSWATRLDQSAVESFLALQESQNEILFPELRATERGPIRVFWSQHKTLKDRSTRATWL